MGVSQSGGRPLRFGVMLLAALLLCTGVWSSAANVTPAAERMLVPVGHTVGIKLFSKGVLVVRQPEDGTPAEECGLRSGDVILQCGGSTITSTEQFQTLLQNCGGSAVALQVRRDGAPVTLSVEPETDERGVYCIGAWIRDSMAGIGTVTYYDPETGAFGALGHGIADMDTAVLMPFSNGSILPSAVKTVKRGASGTAGELKGEFDLTGDLGGLHANTAAGVFGTAETALGVASDAVPVGAPVPGKAVIRTNVQGDAVETFEIEILKVASKPSDERELLLRVTDPALIEITGGIVQGMSGSPIIQDGKLVGAVTHVLLNDPTRGYGISMETMLAAAE